MANTGAPYNLTYPTLAEPPNGPEAVQDLAESVEIALGHHTARLSRSTNQSITTATDTLIAFTTEVWDTDAMIDIATYGNDVIRNAASASAGGLYVVTARVVMASDLAKVEIQHSLSGVIGKAEPTTAATTTTLIATALVYLTGTQSVNVNVRQNSGSGKNVTSADLTAVLLAYV